jgi:uncharacterized protein
MRAERWKWFAMRISNGVVAAALIAFAGAAWAAQPAVEYATPEAAFEKGVAAYKSGAFEAAVPALTEVTAKGSDTARFFAEFYLARIYGDDASGQTDHPKAFMLYRKLADEYTDVDPDDDARAPFVAKALIVLAGYAKKGMRDLNVPANAKRAETYLHHAALFFGDKEAQLELAKLYLAGDARDDIRRALHYLSSLSEQSYPAAQALLAEQLWTGQHLKLDQRRALALITMAVESAPIHERMWVEDIYHSMYCAASHDTRQEADGLVTRLRKMFARPSADAGGQSGREVLAERLCSNGETVAIHREAAPAGNAGAPSVPPAAVAASPPPAHAEMMKGSALIGFGAAVGSGPNAVQKK